MSRQWWGCDKLVVMIVKGMGGGVCGCHGPGGCHGAPVAVMIVREW